MALTLKIVSPEKVIFDGEAENIIVPGTSGRFEVLYNHAPIISSLEAGEVTYKTSNANNVLLIRGGFISVQKNHINVCIET